MTEKHLAIAMEYAPGGDLSEYVDACKRAGVRLMLHSCVFPESPLVSTCMRTYRVGCVSG